MRPGALAVGFDLDYTLWDQDLFFRSFGEAVSSWLGEQSGLGSARVATAFHWGLRELTLHHPRLLGAVLDHLGIRDPGLEWELVTRYRNHRPAMRPYASAVPTLDWLQAAGFHLFLVTDGHSATQRYKVEALGLGPWFDAMVFTDELPGPHAKPSRLPFQLAADRLGVAPFRCLYVGDDPERDVAGPRSLGMGTIGVGTGPFARQRPPGLSPDQRIDALEHLRGLL